MKRVGTVLGLVFLICIVGAGVVFGVEKHQRDVAAAADRARIAAAQAVALANFRSLSALGSRIDATLAQFSSSKDQYDKVLMDAEEASQQRHDLYSKTPGDDADILGYINTEKDDVEQLGALSEAKANAARGAATALGDHFGEATTSSLIADISAASQAEGTGLSDWLRAASDIDDSVAASVNHQFYRSSEDVAALYRTSDEQEAASRSQWDSIWSRMSDLHDRLAVEINAAKDLSGSSGTPVAAPQQTQSTQPKVSDIETAQRLFLGLRAGVLPASFDGTSLSGSTYAFDLYRRDPKFASAFNAAVKDAERTSRGKSARWIEGAGGVASTLKLLVDQNGRQYVIFDECEPHACPFQRFYGFYDPGSNRVAAVLSTSGDNDTARNDDIFATDEDRPMIQILRVMDSDEAFPPTAQRRLEIEHLLGQKT